MVLLLQYYPSDVWDFLVEVEPGLHTYWMRKIRSKTWRKQQMMRGGATAAEAEATHKVGISTLDLYIWAVLLGNTDLAMVLLSACDEPLRGALLGAKLCKKMATLLPVEEIYLKEAAVKHESFAVSLLELCPSQRAATMMLLTPARHWERNVLQFAASSEMKEFIAHRHIQFLIDRALFGDVETYFTDPCKVMLPKRFQRDPQTLDSLRIMAHATLAPLCCGFLKLRPAPGTKEDEIKWTDFYRIPYVKLTLRLVLYQTYALVFAFVVISDHYPEWQQMWVPGLARPAIVMAWWTGALILDEWNQWAVAPQTFVLDFWNMYDYFFLSATSVSLALKLTTSDFLNEFYEYLISFVTSLSHDPRRMLRGGRSHQDEDNDCRCGAVVPVLGPQDFAHRVCSVTYVTPNPGPNPNHTHTHTHTQIRPVTQVSSIESTFLALLNIVVFTRVLQHYSSSAGMGVLIIMVIQMAEDMKLWLALVGIFFVAFSVTFAVMSESDTTAVEAVTKPAWAMFGDLGNIPDNAAGKMLLWAYVMLSNVLLVNLLIAMMNDTYQTIHEKAASEWKFSRAHTILEAIERTYPIPPPFSLPFILGRFLRWCVVHHCSSDGHVMGLKDAEDWNQEDWKVGGRLWMQNMESGRLARIMLLHKSANEEKENEIRIDGRVARFESMMEELLVAQEEMARQMDYIREDMKASHMAPSS